MPKSVKPLVFIDFDETISKKDTIGLLGQVGVEAHDSRIPWSYFVQTYMDDYNREKHNQQQQRQDTSSPLQQKIAEINGMRHVEQASLARVTDSGILGGLSRQQWQEAGATKVQLRSSVQTTLLKQVEPGRLYIVSLNWCKDWIRGALLLGCDNHGTSESFGDYDLKDDHIICNDLEYDPVTHTSTGIIRHSILNTSDKSRVIQSILEKQRLDSATPKSIYIGDSEGDLLPLVECDVGIIIGKNEKLLEALQQVGITVQEGLTPLQSATLAPKMIYRVDEWDEIAQSGILQ